MHIQRQEGDTITLLTNDLERTAVEIGQLYKGRWQIELLFRWIKQHLNIRKFLGNNDNAIRLQLLAAMIAYALLRIAAQTRRITIPILQVHRTRRSLHRSLDEKSTPSTNLRPSIQVDEPTDPPQCRWLSSMNELSPDRDPLWEKVPERSEGG